MKEMTDRFRASLAGFLLCASVLLVLGATGALYRGKFVGGGYAPDFVGHGGGLTNLAADALATGTVPDARLPASSTTMTQFVQNVTFNNAAFFQSNITVSGKATFTNNVFLTALSFAANTSSPPVLTLNCTTQGLRTNNNVSFSGFNIPAEYGVTNEAWATVLITNDSALATIQLFFPGCIGDTNVFVTNQASFTVKKFPGMGTNVAFNSLK